MRPDYIPNDPRWNQQYGLQLIEADLAYDLWDIENGDLPGIVEDGEIVVAITDLGLEWDHSDLRGNIWQNLGEDADGDGVVIVQSGNTWIFDPDDENGIDDDEDGYEDNFIGWDVSNNDNDPMPPTNAYDHGTNVQGHISYKYHNFHWVYCIDDNIHKHCSRIWDGDCIGSNDSMANFHNPSPVRHHDF